MPMASMTCTETSESGWRIAGTGVIRESGQTARHGRAGTVQNACCAAAPGMVAIFQRWFVRNHPPFEGVLPYSSSRKILASIYSRTPQSVPEVCSKIGYPARRRERSPFPSKREESRSHVLVAMVVANAAFEQLHVSCKTKSSQQRRELLFLNQTGQFHSH